jgi:hypothetical protein
VLTIATLEEIRKLPAAQQTYSSSPRRQQAALRYTDALEQQATFSVNTARNSRG